MHISHPPFFCLQGDRFFRKLWKINMSQAYQSISFAHCLCTYLVTARIKWVKFKLTKFSSETTTITNSTARTQDSQRRGENLQFNRFYKLPNRQVSSFEMRLGYEGNDPISLEWVVDTYTESF